MTSTTTTTTTRTEYFNGASPALSATSTSSTESVSPMSPSFYPNELQRALDEASFGIADYQMLPCPSAASQAVARVILLEGQTVFIQLSINGYQVVPNPQDTNLPGSPQLEIVESLDTMLRVLSPKYSTKHTDLLMQRLRCVTTGR